MFIFLLSGLFCCLGFSGVIFFAVWAGACFFLLFGQGPRPRPNSKKKTRPRPNSKKKHAPAPSERVFFCLLFGRVDAFIFLLFGRGGGGGGRVLFLLFGRGACSFFCCLGGGVFFFCCLGGGVFFFLLFGPGACFFFAVWAGDGSSLTYPSAWLVFKRPNNKRKRPNSKKKTRVPALGFRGSRFCPGLGI